MRKTLAVNITSIVICMILGFMVSRYNNTNTVTPSNINIELVGKTSYLLGDLAEFQAVVSNTPKNFDKIVAWKIIKDNKSINFKSIADDDIIFPVGIQPSKITVLMHLAYIDPVTNQLAGSDFFTKEVVVENNNPDNPTPIPPPTPQPSVPQPKDGKYQIAVFVYNNAKSLVKQGNIVKAAQALVKSYSLTANEVIDGKYVTLKEVYAGLKTHNAEAFSQADENKDNWQDWDAAVQKRIVALYNNKQLPNMLDHADLFKEIADGLSYIR